MEIRVGGGLRAWKSGSEGGSSHLGNAVRRGEGAGG